MSKVTFALQEPHTDLQEEQKQMSVITIQILNSYQFLCFTLQSWDIKLQKLLHDNKFDCLIIYFLIQDLITVTQSFVF